MEEVLKSQLPTGANLDCVSVEITGPTPILVIKSQQNVFKLVTRPACQQGLSVAFDLATHCGYDSDNPRSGHCLNTPLYLNTNLICLDLLGQQRGLYLPASHLQLKDSVFD